MPNVDALSRAPIMVIVDGSDIDLCIQVAQTRNKTI